MAERIDSFSENIKQETPNATSQSQNNDAVQEEISNYMTDFILDFLNRTMKNEEEREQENYMTERDNEEESVEELLERAESVIRDNMHMGQINVSEGNSIDAASSRNTSTNTTSTSTSIPTYTSHTLQANIILSDSDSDDEVVFVNSQPSVIPIIDLSSQSDNVTEPTSNRLQLRKRRYSVAHAMVSSPKKQLIDSVPPKVPSPEKQVRLNCAICLETTVQPHSTVCGHIYCGDCIKKTIKITKKCPMCNKALKISNIHPIYF